MAAISSFTLQQVAEHSTRDSLYLAIKGQVYDCTAFLASHPGGEEVLEDVAGQDATEAYEEVGHSEEADGMLKEYNIGKLAIVTPIPRTPSNQASSQLSNPFVYIFTTMALIIGLTWSYFNML